MEYVLVKFQYDWADEFDVYGFKVYSRSEWIKLKTKLEENKDKEVDYSFGTNEGWDERIENFLDSLTVEAIDEHAKILLEHCFDLNKYTWRNHYGAFPPLEQWIED